MKATALEDFIALGRRFAQECLANEPGCLQFDVVRLESTPRGVLFYETYDDAVAFEGHCSSTHLARFKVAFAPLIVDEKQLRRGLA